jgi:hypothetical protein
MFRSAFQVFRNHWRPLALLLLVIACANSPVFFLGRSLVPMLTGAAPGVLGDPPYKYRGPTPSTLTTFDPAGAFNTVFAFDAYADRALKDGSLPFWNPYQGLGQPLLANGQSAVFYPLSWLHLFLPTAWWDLVYLLNWLLAAFFLYAFLRLLGLEAPYAVVGGVTILTNGYFQIYLALRGVPGVAAWWPLMLYAVERTVQEPFWRHRHWVLALGVYCTVTAGQPEVAFLSLFSLLIYALISLPRATYKWRIFGSLALGSLAGLLLSAPQWLNFAAYAFTCYSSHTPGSGWGLAHLPYQLITAYFFPNFLGIMHSYPLKIMEGWWNLSPGWTLAVPAFLAFASLGALFRKPTKGLLFFTIVALVTAAKIYGAPGINSLGSLPFFERIIHMRYGGFLLAFSLAGMAAYGLRYLTELSPSRWLPWLGSWTALIVAVWAWGIYWIWPNLKAVGFFSIPASGSLPFAASGILWAVAAPLALWWIRRRHPQELFLFYVMVSLGILLQGIAYAPHGFTRLVHLVFPFIFLAVFLLAVALLGRSKKSPSNRRIIIYAILISVSPLIVTTLLSPFGLPLRYDPLTRPPFIDYLLKAQEQGKYRSYSFDAAPQPNFAAPFGLSNLGVNEALAPQGTARFIRTYLDRGASPLWLSANTTGARKPQEGIDPVEQLSKNFQFFSLVATRFIVAQNTDPFLKQVYDTEAHGQPKVPLALTEPLSAKIVWPDEELSQVQVFLSTYIRPNPGTVTLKILGPDGAVTATAGIPGIEVRDNQFNAFAFSSLQGLRGKEIRLELSFDPSAPGSMIAAWIYPQAPELGFTYRLGTRDFGKTCALVYHEPETGVRIWENPQAVPRLFLAPAAEVASSWEEALARLKGTSDLTRQVWLIQGPALQSSWPQDRPPGELVSFRLEDNEVYARFAAYTGGILTLTDSFSPGWQAFVNGQAVPVLLVDGVFRGIRLNGPGTYEVRFRYRPPYWNLSLGLAVFGLVLLAGSSWLSKHMGGRPAGLLSS